MMKWKFARIIGYDAAGIDDYALHAGALPIFAPPRDVIAGRGALCNICLAPAIDAAIPWEVQTGLSRKSGCASRACPDEITSGHIDEGITARSQKDWRG